MNGPVSQHETISRKEIEQLRAELLEKQSTIERLQMDIEKFSKINIRDFAIKEGSWCFFCKKVINEDENCVCEYCGKYICDVDHYSIYENWDTKYFCGKVCIKKYVTDDNPYYDDDEQYRCLDRYNKR
jgi:hypothetical protein